MIRAVTVTSLVTLLMLVLYLPSSRTPEHFLAQMRIEHERAVTFWGPPTAERIFDRMLTLQDHAQGYSPVPAANSGPHGSQVAPAVAHEMAQVNARLFNNSYFRSIDALLALASYRLATLLEWLPAWRVIAAVLLLDALLVRARKAKELRLHDPELFALYVCAAILMLCGCTLAFVWPWSLPPLVWAMSPPAMAFVVARAISHFHRMP